MQLSVSAFRGLIAPLALVSHLVQVPKRHFQATGRRDASPCTVKEVAARAFAECVDPATLEGGGFDEFMASRARLYDALEQCTAAAQDSEDLAACRSLHARLRLLEERGMRDAEAAEAVEDWMLGFCEPAPPTSTPRRAHQLLGVDELEDFWI